MTADKHTRPATATIARGKDKRLVLKQAVEAEGFWQALEAASAGARLTPEQTAILVKPDFEHFDVNSPTGTEPELVECLIDLLWDRGFTSVNVGCAADSTTRWLENREPLALADIAGYRFVTKLDRPYTVVDLGDELVPVDWPADSVLHDTGLSRHWTEAVFRISFAKNKTDLRRGYALTLHNILGVLPEQDKNYFYGRRCPAEEACLDVLRLYPPHFCLIDAWVSNHGSAGARMMKPIETSTLIASGDALLADWAGALKMEIDPCASGLNARAIEVLGLPPGHRIRGDLTPYPGWINAPAILRQTMQQPIEFAPLERIEAPLTQWVNRDVFPFKDYLNDRVNQFFTGGPALDENPFAMLSVVWANYCATAVGQAVQAWSVLYAKDRLDWKERPLGIDPDQFSHDDYEAVAEYLEPFEREAAGLQADEYGLAWTYVDKSVLFRFDRIIPVPFDKFVARVDVAQAITYMNDYLGGVRVPVDRDQRGRITHQVERNIYLPQPNYLALSGGVEIDVTKIEVIRYSSGEHKIFWKTVKSENGSAVYDDGSVSFERTGAGTTRIAISGLQQFTLPWLWQVFDPDRFPPLKDYLVTHAYRTFFSQTVANFEAAWEGREFRIGRSWRASSTDGSVFPTNVVEKFDAAAKLARGAALQVKNRIPLLSRPTAPPGGDLDETGFRHFAATGVKARPNDVTAFVRTSADRVLDFVSDLAKAMAKDLGLLGRE
jgi:uncharacterized protein (DUF362 family)